MERPGTTAPATGTGDAADLPAFHGFSPATLVFLAGLEHDNTKRYLDVHRATYRAELFEPSKAFVVTLGAALRQRVGAGPRVEPRIGGSLFRIAPPYATGNAPPNSTRPSPHSPTAEAS